MERELRYIRFYRYISIILRSIRIRSAHAFDIVLR